MHKFLMIDGGMDDMITQRRRCISCGV